MKKIYLLTLATLFAGAISAQRSLDLSLTLTEPADGTTVPQSDDQTLDFNIKNLGDDLIENDTIVLYLFNQTTQTQYSLDQAEGYITLLALEGQVGAAILPMLNGGSDLTAADMGGLTLDLTLAGFNVGDQIMVAAEVWGANGEEEDQSTLGDNSGSFTIGAATTSLTINTKDINVYPNPATNVVNFKVDGLENGKIVINSITGQEVVNTTISNSKQVDVSNLNNGVYIYTVRNANGEVVKTNKLVISK